MKRVRHKMSLPIGEKIPDILPLSGMLVYFPAFLVTKCETPVRIARSGRSAS